MMNRYEQEFGPMADMPHIPAHWKDVSWHNDVCPSFEAKRARGIFVRIWVNYLNPDDREFTESRRYLVELSSEDGSEEMELFASEKDWQAVVAFANRFQLGSADHLALIFADEMATTLDEHEMALVNQRNAEEFRPNMRCHSYDFCHANTVMEAAMQRCGIELADPIREPHAVGPQQILIAEAWETARLCDFDTERVLSDMALDYQRIELEPTGLTCDDLSELYRAWAAHVVGRELGSADEHRNDPALTLEQRALLARFCVSWDETFCNAKPARAIQ